MQETGAVDSSGFQVGTNRLNRTAWWQIATLRGVDPYILYAVALVESACNHRSLAKPWPWALNQAGKSILPRSKAEASTPSPVERGVKLTEFDPRVGGRKLADARMQP
jgi:hypothetical protein